jgi:hypothetical protein
MSNTVPFAVQQALAPALTGITPSQGSLGTTVPVTLNGVNLISDLTIDAGSGVAVAAVSISPDGTSASATLQIDRGAVIGARNIVVTTSGGQGSASFTLLPLVPVFSAMVPISAVPGATVPVTLYGQNFDAGGFTVNGPAGTALIVSGAAVVSATVATATFAFNTEADAGLVPISVSTAGGESETRSFTVLAATPRLTGMTPNNIPRGARVENIVLVGENFAPEMVVSSSGTGVTISNLNVTSPTQATMTVTSEHDAFAGFVSGFTTTFVPRQFRSSLPVGASILTSNSLNMTLNFAPALATMEPNSFAQGQQYTVTFTGSNFIFNPAAAAGVLHASH